MLVIAQHPQRYGLQNIGGKAIDHIAWYTVDRIPRDKEVMDVVTDDGSVYRWSRFGDDERWTYEHRVRPDGSRDDATRPLPAKVDTLVDRSETVLY